MSYLLQEFQQSFCTNKKLILIEEMEKKVKLKRQQFMKKKNANRQRGKEKEKKDCQILNC